MEDKYTFRIEERPDGTRAGRKLVIYAAKGHYEHGLPALFREELIDMKDTIEEYIKKTE